MNEKIVCENTQFPQTRGSFHRLRRYPHNGITESDPMMAGEMLNGGNRRLTLLVLSILLLSSLPLVPNASADVGIPEELQAQDIDVEFDNVSETTTITWRNIEQTGGQPELFGELWDATYHVYRHTAPITPSNIDSLSPWHSVIACDKDVLGGSELSCRGQGGNPHPGHTATYQVGAGTNGSFFYAITTELGDGNISAPLDFNASSLYEPVVEITTPIRSPYNIQASFNPGTSQTTIQWINYNSINPVLPETGPDALQINIWQTDFMVQRSNGETLLNPATPGVTKVATLSSTATQYVLDVPPSTNREVYYSVTYLLPNWADDGSDYEDTRFLSNNAMSNALLEDNTPPDDIGFVTAQFTPNENGTGYTTILWDGLFSEENEVYKIYRHGEMFNSTNDPYVQLIATISEDADEDEDGAFEFHYNIPYNTYGDFFYCVVVVDQYGAYNSDISQSSCDSVDEDADDSWVKEPTNVQATFIGNRTTRVTWTDQAGVEGERYHIWRGGWRVQGPEFVANASLMWMGSVSDGVEQFDVHLEPGIQTTSTHYFVTSEALYNCPGCNGTMMYTQLVQNWDGPVIEDTEAPSEARISDLQMLGELKVVDLEWINSVQEVGESYYIYRHFGDPFGDSEFAISNYTDPGWEFYEGPIAENNFSTVIRQIPVPEDSQRDVWYAVIVADSFGNINPTILPGIGGNTLMVTEDTQAPTITYFIADENGVALQDNSLVRGEYTLRIQVSETLEEFPIVNITTSNGGSLTGGSEQAMVLLSQNTNNPDKGPEFFQTFSISSTTIAGDMMITINMTDLVLNSVDMEISEFSIDAKDPVVTIFSPTSQGDGAKYLYGNEIKIVAGATDDVSVVSMQMRFVQNYESEANRFTEPWRNVTGITINDDGDWTIEMSFSSGNFLPGVHEVSVKAFDSAGNEDISKVLFVTDQCRHRLSDGTTICEHSNPVPEDPETIYPELNATDPPYMIAWVTAGASLLAVIVSLFVISTAMSGPKRKKDDDDDVGDDWMSEFIGTTAEPDMAEITGTAPAAQTTSAAPDDEDDDDPFAVNIVQQKRRRKKKKPDDDDDDEEEEDVDWEEGEAPRKKPKRRSASRRKAPKRKRS